MGLERLLLKLSLRLRTLFRRSAVEDDLADEVADHLHRRTAEFITRGLPPTAARDAALKAFGGVEQRKEDCRDARRMGVVEDALQDLRYAGRMMRRSPGFTAVAVVSLALGIGANTAVFRAIDAVLLRNLPVAAPGELVMLTWSSDKYPTASVDSLIGASNRYRPGETLDVFPYATFDALAQQGDLFAGVLATSGESEPANVGLAAGAQVASLIGVSASYFDTLGVRALLGRTFDREDDREGAAPVAVVSHRFWQQRLGGDRAAIGTPLAINGSTITVVGVAPPAFFGLQTGELPDLWVPLHTYARHPAFTSVDRSGGPAPGSGPALLTDSKAWFVRIVGRRRPAQSDRQVEAIAGPLFHRSIDLRSDVPAAETPHLHTLPIPRGFERARRRYASSLLLLMALVGAVLLIACANLAGLLLERAASREREMAVRLSLGVSRGRLVRQLLTESLALAALGGVAALAVANWLHPVLMRLLSEQAPPSHLGFALDWSVLAFTIAISVMVALIFGLAPALRTTRLELVGHLRQRSGTRQGRRGISASRVLIAAQISLCLLLLIAAGLFVRTWQKLEATDVGFDRSGLVQFTVRPGLNGYAPARLTTYYEQLRERLAAVPGIRAVTLASRGPIGNGQGGSTGRIAGITTDDNPPTFYRHQVGPDYFRTLGLTVLAGRPIDAGDVGSAPKVVVVNERVARDYFKNESAIGRHIRLGTAAAPLDYEIVGVVQNAKYGRLQDDIPPTVYLPYQQFLGMPETMRFLVRTSGSDLAGLIPQIHHEADAIDATVPVTDEHSQLDMIDRTLASERTFATLTSAFGLVAMLLACIGIYGTLAYSVSRRTSEIGVRMALGASPGRARLLVLRDSAAVVGAGIAIGLAASIAVMRLLSARFYGISPFDPVTLIGVPVALALVTVAASLVPAHRAASVDPVTAMRCE